MEKKKKKKKVEKKTFPRECVTRDEDKKKKQLKKRTREEEQTIVHGVFSQQSIPPRPPSQAPSPRPGGAHPGVVEKVDPASDVKTLGELGELQG